MTVWGRDCILFSTDREPESIKPKSPFERFTTQKINNETLQIKYTWSDPIKIQEKIVDREQKSVLFWKFNDKRVVCAFGNSESSIWYGIKRYCSNSGSLNKLDIFQYFKMAVCSKKKWFADLVSLYLLSTPDVFDKTELKKVAKEVTSNELIMYLQQDKIASLTFRWAKRNTYFYLDTNSVISFYDTTSDNQILDIIKEVVESFEHHL